MISFQQFRSFFLSMSLSVLLATTIAFGFGNSDSWAAIISPSPTQIATMNQAEKVTKDLMGKAQEAIANITGDPNPQATKEAKRFKAKTLEGISNSIENPKYQPGGKVKQAVNEDRESTEDMKNEARDAMDSYQK